MTTVLESLNSALHQLFSEDQRVYLIGQDILDPYGGAFKVTRGLSSGYPDRVLAAPISEAAMVGIASGMALRGLLPIVEIMFGDFLALAADQIINHMSKFRWMYNDQVQMPVVIRTPMGGRRGYGPTHSQTLEKIFLGLPDLFVLAPTNLGDPGGLLKHAVYHQDYPKLIVENKLLYLQSLPDKSNFQDFEIHQDTLYPYDYPYYRVKLRDAPRPILTIASYGYMADVARQAVYRLGYEFEIFIELVVYTQLSPFVINPLIDSLQTTNKLLTVEEGGISSGWGAEIIARAVESAAGTLHTSRRVAALDMSIPASSTLEAVVLPGVETIIQTARDMVEK